MPDPRSAPPGLLLLHGVGDSGDCWGPFVTRLRARDGLADLIVGTPSANGHDGQPLRRGHTLSTEDQVAAATAAAEELVARTGGPIVLGGHSMGAAVALATVAERPDLAAALYLEDPPISLAMPQDDAADPDLPIDVSSFIGWFRDLQGRPLADVVAMVSADHPGWDEAEYEPWARAKQSVDTEGFVGPIRWVGTGWARRARVVTCPALLIRGENARGGIVNPVAAEEIAALPGWTVTQVPTGHDVRRDAPDMVVPLLAELIGSVTR